MHVVVCAYKFQWCSARTLEWNDGVRCGSGRGVDTGVQAHVDVCWLGGGKAPIGDAYGVVGCVCSITIARGVRRCQGLTQHTIPVRSSSQNGMLMCRFAAPTCWNFYHIIRMTKDVCNGCEWGVGGARGGGSVAVARACCWQQH